MTHPELSSRQGPVRPLGSAEATRLVPSPRQEPPGLLPINPSPIGPETPGPDMVDRFTSIVRHQDDPVLEGFLADLLRQGVAAESIFLDLLAPTAARLGELWEEDRCDFVEVTLAVGRLQRVLRSLSQTVLHHRSADLIGSALLACLPGEQHTLGMFMVAEFLAKEGFDVTVGPPIESQSLLAIVSGKGFDLVGLSVAGVDHLVQARNQISAIRRRSCNPKIRILVGGFAIQQRPEAVKWLGADGSAADAETAARMARELTQPVP